MQAFFTMACSVMGACAFGLSFVPHPLRVKLEAFIRALWEKLFLSADPFDYIEIPLKNNSIPSDAVYQVDGNGHCQIFKCNPLYDEVGVYLGSLNIEFETRRVCVYGVDHEHHGYDHSPKFVFGLPLNQTLADTFDGSQLSWTHTIAPTSRKSRSPDEYDDAKHIFTLSMLKSEKRRILRPYLHHISTVAREIQRRNSLRTLYRNGDQHRCYWRPVVFKHPSTFNTIALDGDLGQRIQDDLKAFSESEQYYHSIGRAWKRGYLLYGPPGTGKSSLIAAIANFMQYDIYDLELTNVLDNSGLQSLLMQTKRKSIIVIEDIDCSMKNGISEGVVDVSNGRISSAVRYDVIKRAEVQKSSRGLTLSGLLNFADGLLSCLGEERIFIFTTNHKESLDSALLRCGRMDMHILLSYCTFSALKKLALNYLGINNHAFYEELEEAMKPGVKITPATIAEILISGRKDPDAALKQVMASVKACEPLDGKDSQKNQSGCL